MTSSTVLLRTASIKRCGVPPHKKADSSTFVLMTNRTLL
jgi:hypothetical protein